MVRRGELRPEEASKHRLRHVITNVMGGGQAGVTVEAHALEVAGGDRLLICSDGLTEMVSNEQIRTALASEADPEACCRKLVAQANEAGGRDNITVVICRFDDAGA
jgi:protein phosphatase